MSMRIPSFHTVRLSAMIASFGVATAMPVFAQCENQLLPDEEDLGWLFGWDVDQDGDRMVVGYPRFHGVSGESSRSGKALVYRRVGPSWVQEAELFDVELPSITQFGWSVGISGEVIVIGVPDDKLFGGTVDDVGSAYVFRQQGGTWVREAKLRASDLGPDQSFGRSVDIDGDYIVIGARHGDGVSLGGAYVFRREGTNWVEQAKLTSGLPENVGSGWSVSIDGERIAVAAFPSNGPCPKDPDCDSGSVYVFRRDGETWAQEVLLTAADAAEQAGFATTVSLDGDILAVGSFGSNEADPQDPSCHSGSAYVFRRVGMNWAQEAKLVAGDATCRDSFGRSVSIDGGVLAIGAPHTANLDGLNRLGSAYLFKHDGTGWTEKVRVTASDGAPRDAYGWAVSVKSGSLVVGAYKDNAATGSVYTYSVSDAIEFQDYGDLNKDGLVDLFDLFCVLKGFSGNFDDCTFEDTDVHPPCQGGDGTIDVFDLFAVLDAFSAIKPCCF